MQAMTSSSLLPSQGPSALGVPLTRPSISRNYLQLPCSSPVRKHVYRHSHQGRRASARGRVNVRASGDGQKKSKISWGDQLLDYIEAGPKLRKWYGAPDQMPRDGLLPGDLRDGGRPDEDQGQEQEEEEEEEAGPADAVLVTDGDSETGQMVVLSLILKRRKIRALVKDAELATAGFGPYVEPIVGDVGDPKAVSKALKGVGTVIFTSKVGCVADVAKGRRVEHFILLSQVGVSRPPSGLGALIGASARESAKRDEALVAASGVPLTVIRTGDLRDQPSGLGVALGQGDELRGSLSREDAAAVCLAALEAGAPEAKERIFEVVNAASGLSSDEQLLEAIQGLGAPAASPAS